MSEAQTQFDVIEANYNAERDLINQLVGKQLLADASEQFFRTVRISDLARIKENKLYRAIRGMKTPNGSEFLAGTWDEFCTHLLGKSVDKVDLDISNLREFGEEALESMQQIGIGYREMRQYRKLPTDAKEALIEAAKTGDKETLLDLAEELISRHVKEKSDLTAQVQELEANYEAQGRVLEQKNSAFDKLSEQYLAKEARAKTLPPDEVAKELRSEANLFAFRAEHSILNELLPAFRALDEHSRDNGGDHTEYMTGLVVQIELAVARIREDFGLDKNHPDSDPTPVWMRPESEAAVKQAEEDWAKRKAEWAAGKE